MGCGRPKQLFCSGAYTISNKKIKGIFAMKLSITSEAELSDDLSRFLSSETELNENSNITAIYQAKFIKENDGLSLSFLYYNISSSLYYAVSFPCCNDKITLSSLYPLIDSFFHFPVEKGSLLLLDCLWITKNILAKSSLIY